MTLENKLKKIITEIPTINSREDARYILCKISYVFEKEDVKKITIEKYGGILLDILDSTLKNDFFMKILKGLIIVRKNHKYTSEDYFFRLLAKNTNNKGFNRVKEKRIINLFLSIGFFGITLCLGQLSEDFIQKIRYRLANLSRSIEKKSDNMIDIGSFVSNMIEITTNKRYFYNDVFPLKRIGIEEGNRIDKDFLFINNLRNHDVIKLSFIFFMYFRLISDPLKNMNYNIHLATKLNNLYKSSKLRVISKTTNHFVENKGNKNAIISYIEGFRNTNEIVISYIIEKITSGFHLEDLDLENKILGKVKDSTNLKDDIINFCTSRFTAFNNINNKEASERSNKIFLITIELLSIFEIIKKSKDRSWSYNTAARSLHIWIEKFNNIVNKNELIDDRDAIKDFIYEENDIVEWKSTFFTETEKQSFGKEADDQERKKMINKIIDPMIGMMNNKGGVIIVGLCENPDKIIREDIKINLIKKNNKIFYNIEKELESLNMDIDHLKRHIQDLIKSKTKVDMSKTDDLWELNQIKLYDSEDPERIANIIKVTIKSSNTFIPLYYENGGKIRRSILMRINGRTIPIDPIDYLVKD